MSLNNLIFVSEVVFVCSVCSTSQMPHLCCDSDHVSAVNIIKLISNINLSFKIKIQMLLL